MALTCLFLATKNEENYIPAELLVKISYYCQHEKRLDNTDHEKDGFNVSVDILSRFHAVTLTQCFPIYLKSLLTT